MLLLIPWVSDSQDHSCSPMSEILQIYNIHHHQQYPQQEHLLWSFVITEMEFRCRSIIFSLYFILTLICRITQTAVLHNFPHFIKKPMSTNNLYVKGIPFPDQCTNQTSYTVLTERFSFPTSRHISFYDCLGVSQ